MSDVKEVFLGLSNIAWTAISSIATAGALVYVLLDPITAKIKKKNNVYHSIEKEIKKNLSFVRSAYEKRSGQLKGEEIPRYELISSILEWINNDYWKENKQFVSESSKRKYDEYLKINEKIDEIKKYADEIIKTKGQTGFVGAITEVVDKFYIEICKNNKYSKMIM
jgi:hypothetical protein